MKNKCKTKKTFSILSLFLLISFFVFTTCSNVSSGTSAYNSKTTNKKTFKGTISLMGAVPVSPDDVASSNSSETPRSAVPDITGDFSYFARATSSGKPTISIDGDQISSVNGKVTFSMDLEKDIKWKITAGIKKEGNEILIDVFEAKLSDDNPILSHDFVLKANTNTLGNGIVDLGMTIPTSVTYIKTECSSTAWTPVVTIDSNTPTSAKIYCASVPRGNYELTIDFYDEENGVILYSTTQPVCVIADFTTKKWGENSSDGVITSGQFVLSDTQISDFERPQIYVSGNGSDSCANGSRYSPYKTLKNAVKIIGQKGKNIDYTILIDGEITGTTEITSTLLPSGKALSLTICGLNSNSSDKLNAAQNGRVLKVATEVPITIKNLTITGGKVGMDENGNRIKNVPVETGAGGGIYIASGSTVIMEDGAVIGDNNSSINTAAGKTSCANCAVYGGGIYCEGTLTLKNGAIVKYNYIDDAISNGPNADYSLLGTGGGGICCNNGTLTIENGAKVSFNGANARGADIGLKKASFTMTGGEINNNESSCWGGGIAVSNKDTNTKLEISGGIITGNVAQGFHGGAIFYEPMSNSGDFVISGNTEIKNNISGNEGGGICILSCDLKISGGTLSNNSSSFGGAVYVADGSFHMSGSAKIPYGVTENGSLQTSAGKNDVYLASGKTITLSDNLAQHDTNNKLYITSEWKRGTKILSTENDFTLSDAVIKKIDFTQPSTDGWFAYICNSDKEAKINAPIYVGTKGTLTGLDTNAGTYSSPFATIERACKEMDDANTDYFITVNGTVSGSQIIPSSLLNSGSGAANKYYAKSITLKGETSNSADIITAVKDGTSEGTTLTVNSTVPVTIKKLTITGGDASLNGGGIYVSAGSVCLSDGAKVTGNKATKYGGGVYVASSAKLFMCGSSLIGDSYSSTTTAIAEATSTNTKPWANMAEQGGGIYNTGSVYIGYSGIDSETNQPVVSAMTDKYGVRRNYASSYGGGIQTQGLTSIKSGYISYNQAATSGGGIWGGTSDSAKPVNINGATICGNKAASGAGLYVESGEKVSMSSGTIGGSGTSGNVANDATYGGGVDVASNATFEMTGGTISYNTATYGGGVHICSKGTESYDGKFTFTQGSISNNSATSYGGGIYSDGTLDLGSNARIPYGVGNSKAVNKNDVYLADGKTISVPTSLSQHSELIQISVIPEKPAKHLPVLSGNNLTSVYTCFNYPGKGFSIKDTGKLELKNIVEEIYVSAAGSDPSGNTKDDSTWNQNPYTLNAKSYNESTTYSQQYPFKTIDMALKFITYQESADTTYYIRIKGTGDNPTITGANSIADNTDTNNPISLSANATKIIIRAMASKATLSGGDSVRPLTINTTVPVELQSLDVTSGSAENGGGIYVNSGSTLILGLGSKVCGNKASANGGGIYNAGTLIVKSSAIIGEDGTYSGPPSSNGGSNTALFGGGIYTTGDVWFGYTEAAANKADQNFAGKIIYNRATSYGGGVYVADGGKFYMSKGQISYNCTVTSNPSCGGGGVYIASSGYSSRGNFYMYGGTMTKNWHHGALGHGGAVFITANTWLTMSGSASIPYESINKGDVYTEKSGEVYGYISVDGTLTANGTVATVTPDIFNIGRDIALCSSVSYRSSAKNKIALAQTGDNSSGRYKTEINGNGVEIQLDLSKVTDKSWITSYMQGKSYNTSPDVLYTFEYETTKTFILRDNNWGGIAVVTVSCTYFNNREDDGDCSAEFTITTKSIEGTNTALEQGAAYYDFDFTFRGNDAEMFLYYGVVAPVSDTAQSSFYLWKTEYDTIELTQGGNVEWYMLP